MKFTLAHIRAEHEGEIPPVEQRPTCPYCEKPLRIRKDCDTEMKYNNEQEKMEFKKNYSGKWRYDSYGFFCTLRCGCNYANNVMKKQRG